MSIKSPCLYACTRLISGFKPFGSTFLTFSDYMKPAIRLSALMNLPVNYIFTDSRILECEKGE